MVRTVVTPLNNYLQVQIPLFYIGKEVEVFLYIKEELIEEEKIIIKENTMAQFKGILTTEEADQLQQYVKKSREEWE